VFAYDVGKQMVRVRAPARRVALLFDEASSAPVTAAGRALWDAALTWVLERPRP
jgi:hypothetical protein